METGTRTLTKFDVNANSQISCSCNQCMIGRDLKEKADGLLDDTCKKLGLTYDEIGDLLGGNLAFAKAEIDGRTYEMAAHSRINNDAVTWIPKTTFIYSQLPTTFPQYEYLKVNVHRELNRGSIRENDSEARILLALDLTLQQQGIGYFCDGVVNLYTYREPCLSCDNVMIQFLRKYTKLSLNIYFEDHYPKWPKKHGGGR
ncbi:deaminase domain-containing protein [Brevibacillus fluminis]|uniref:deaminase domain-containing protein n=1 Tax=Brevibacillus fluminis TaxID=511487 RepID=UPI003F8AAC18